MEHIDKSNYRKDNAGAHRKSHSISDPFYRVYKKRGEGRRHTVEPLHTEKSIEVQYFEDLSEYSPNYL